MDMPGIGLVWKLAETGQIDGDGRVSVRAGLGECDGTSHSSLVECCLYSIGFLIWKCTSSGYSGL